MKSYGLMNKTSNSHNLGRSFELGITEYSVYIRFSAYSAILPNIRFCRKRNYLAGRIYKNQLFKPVQFQKILKKNSYITATSNY